MSNTYILLKDISQPNDHDLKSGTEFRKKNNTPDSAYVSECGRRSFHPVIVEKSTEWFKLKEQVEEKRIEVKKFCLQSSSDKESWYEFLIKGYITEDKYEAVKQAIENVLTDIPQYYCGIRPEQLTIETIKRDYKPPVVVVNGERYIEEQKDAIPPTPEPQDSKEEPKPLLITDDNVKLFKEEDLYWRVYDDFSYGQFMVKDKASYSTEATFISEELASAYVQLRKNKVNIRIS